MFLIVKPWPNITFSIVITICFTKNPSYSLFEAIKTIFYYLKGLINRGIIYGEEKKLIIKRYSDSDQVYNKKNHRLISGFIFILKSSSISCNSKRQSMVVLFSKKVEYIALIFAVKEAIWFQLFLTKLGFLKPNNQLAKKTSKKVIRASKHWKAI